MSVFIGYPSFMAYQMMKGKKGNNDGFPSIPGMIARYSALGLTNEQMAENPVWKDLTGNGHDLQMKNFLWAGMSGVNGYVDNFNKFYLSEVRADATFTSNSVNFSSIKSISAQFYMQSTSGETKRIIPSYFIKVTGLEDGQSINYQSGSPNILITKITEDGVYELPSFEFKGSGTYYGFQLNKIQESCDITIEQLPFYPGAIVFDGVDDYGICENFPILTKEKGYTVVALRQWISMGEGISGLVSNVKNWFNDGAFVLEYNSNNATNKFVNRPVSFGNVNIEMDLPNNFTYQTSKGVPITTGSFKGTNSLFVGKLNNIIGNCSNVAIRELVFLDHDATEEELTKIKDYFIKTYPWLFPDQAWTVTGKTNEDTDRATIANITGNGNNLVLSNFGFIEGSGYNEEGEYAGYLVTDGVDDSGRAVGLTISKDFTLVGEWILFSKTSVNAGLSIHPQIHIFNRPEAIQIMFRTAGKTLPVKSLKAICSDGRCYDENWSELKINVGEFTNNKGTLFVASNGTNYAQIAFKNLGIYDNQILSKNDCIKAYNYLQTLKAK